MASRGHSFSLGCPSSFTALVMLKYAGQMLQRPHLEYSFTARTADSATTHSVVHRLHASTPTSPSRLLMHRAAFTRHTTCPLAFFTRKPAPPSSTARTVRLVRTSFMPSLARKQKPPPSRCPRHRRGPAHPPRYSCSCSWRRTDRWRSPPAVSR